MKIVQTKPRQAQASANADTVTQGRPDAVVKPKQEKKVAENASPAPAGTETRARQLIDQSREGHPVGLAHSAQSGLHVRLQSQLSGEAAPVVESDAAESLQFSPAELKEALAADIDIGLRMLRRFPPAITFFGGARIEKDDPYYEMGVDIGARLAKAGIPPRTGAGPGIMEAVPEGYKTALKTLEGEAVDNRFIEVVLGAISDPAPSFQPVIDGFAKGSDIPVSETQGFSIKLPYEQSMNEHIDRGEEMLKFVYRKLVLYENARGLVTFPGGYGTLDELFEVWALAERGAHDDPMAVVGEKFWQPLLDPIENVAVRGQRKLIPEDVWSRMFVTDDSDALLRHMSDRDTIGFENDPHRLAAELTEEIGAAVDTLASLPPAVSFLGAERLAADDPTLEVARKIAAGITEAGQSARVGGSEGVVEAVEQGVSAQDPSRKIQGFQREGDPALAAHGAVEVHFESSQPTTHKELLTRNIEGLVVMPGDLNTLDQLFTLLTEIQCGKVKPVPIVLVGSDYWGPIFDAVQSQMLNGERKTISAHDLTLFRIVDDADEALQILGQKAG